MPSGKTHDRITLICTPIAVIAMYAKNQDLATSLIFSGSFLFAGLMFGPDLDIVSVQSRRWGILSWIWIPYRRSLRHRSLWSHGFLFGTVGRCIYLAIVLSLLGTATLVAIAGAAIAQGQEVDFSPALSALQSFDEFSRGWPPTYWLSTFGGLELGAMSHSIADWLGSWWLRRRSSR